MSRRDWWDAEATADPRYATLAWGGDGTPEQVQPTIDKIVGNVSETILDALEHWTSGPFSVCELGCGPGRILHRLARRYPDFEFLGIDISQTMLDLGEADRPSNVSALAAPIEHVSGTGNIDVVYSVEVFQHLESFHKMLVLRVIKELLKPDGVALIQWVDSDEEEGSNNYPADTGWMAMQVISAGFEIIPKPTHEQVHDEWRWLEIRKERR